MQNDVLKGWLSFTPKMRPCQGVPVGGGGALPCSLKIMVGGEGCSFAP